MSQPQRVTWAAVIGAIAAALSIGSFVARSVAQAEIVPVRERVTAVETKQQSTEQRLESMDKKLDRLIDMHLQTKETNR